LATNGAAADDTVDPPPAPPAVDRAAPEVADVAPTLSSDSLMATPPHDRSAVVQRAAEPGSLPAEPASRPLARADTGAPPAPAPASPSPAVAPPSPVRRPVQRVGLGEPFVPMSRRAASIDAPTPAPPASHHEDVKPISREPTPMSHTADATSSSPPVPAPLPLVPVQRHAGPHDERSTIEPPVAPMPTVAPSLPETPTADAQSAFEAMTEVEEAAPLIGEADLPVQRTSLAATTEDESPRENAAPALDVAPLPATAQSHDSTPTATAEDAPTLAAPPVQRAVVLPVAQSRSSDSPVAPRAERDVASVAPLSSAQPLAIVQRHVTSQFDDLTAAPHVDAPGAPAPVESLAPSDVLHASAPVAHERPPAASLSPLVGAHPMHVSRTEITQPSVSSVAPATTVAFDRPRVDRGGNALESERPVAAPSPVVQLTPSSSSPVAAPRMDVVATAPGIGAGSANPWTAPPQQIFAQQPASSFVVSREAVDAAPPPAPEPTPAPPPSPTPAPAPTATTDAPAPAGAPAAGGSGGASDDELSERLYDRIRDRLRAELRDDRDRAGLLTDLIR
jgi:hypothetical protein